MTTEQFTYWLQGFMEINDPETLGVRETQIIKDHLALVFNKKTPTRVGTGYGVPNKTEIVTNPYEKGYPTVNPYTVTCTDSNPFNDKFDATIDTLRPANVYNNTTSTSKLIC